MRNTADTALSGAKVALALDTALSGRLSFPEARQTYL
jgi:hypothetical protein